MKQPAMQINFGEMCKKCKRASKCSNKTTLGKNASIPLRHSALQKKINKKNKKSRATPSGCTNERLVSCR